MRGGGLLEKSASQGADARWLAARELGLVVGMPPKLFYLALEITADSSNNATSWLLEHGSSYASLPWMMEGALDTPSLSHGGEKLWVTAPSVHLFV